MTQFLVIGGAGYIGSHVAKELGRQGYGVVVLDNLMADQNFLLRIYSKIVIGPMGSDTHLSGISMQPAPTKAG